MISILLIISGCASAPLIKASANGDSLAVQKLIDAGANINEPDSKGYTPLMHAIWSGKIETVKILTNKGADVNKRDLDGCTPLLWATYYKYSDIAKLLIDNGADINAQDATGATALHCTNSLALTQYLLDRNADTTLKNASGWTALRQSIYDKNIGKVALIRKKTNWQGEIYPLTSEEKIGRSVYEPEKDMFDVPSDKESAYKLATHDCNTMIFKNVSAGQVILELNWFGLPSLARAASKAYQREELFQQCMAVMGFECKKNCSKDSKPVAPK
jgi:ankyrin repeat protein